MTARRITEATLLTRIIAVRRCRPDGTPVVGQQFTYSFENIGNRTYAYSGGDTAARAIAGVE